MDSSHFDAVIRSLSGSRRSLLGGSLALAAGWLGISATEAKKKHKKRKPKAKPNAFGCLEVGDACKNATQCCSGICDGKKGKKRCKAHDTGTCQQDLSGICSDPPTVATCNNSDTCLCLTSTANSNFCGQTGAPVCAECQKDADCEALGLPPGSACLPTAGIYCAAQCPETGMVCLPPCGAEMPEK